MTKKSKYTNLRHPIKLFKGMLLTTMYCYPKMISTLENHKWSSHGICITKNGDLVHTQRTTLQTINRNRERMSTSINRRTPYANHRLWKTFKKQRGKFVIPVKHFSFPLVSDAVCCLESCSSHV